MDLRSLKQSTNKMLIRCIKEAQYADDAAIFTNDAAIFTNDATIFANDATVLQCLLSARNQLWKPVDLRINIKKREILSVCHGKNMLTSALTGTA